MINKFRMPAKLKVALLIFTLVGSLAVAFLPRVASTFGASNAPSLLQLAFTGIFLIIATTILLWYAAKTIGLGRGWFLLALAYNSLIILIKFVLSPSSLYQQTYRLDALSFDFNPNVQGGYIWVGALVLLLYAGAFAIIYAVYRKKMKTALLVSSPQPSQSSQVASTESKHSINFFLKAIIIIGILFLGVITRFLFVPLFFAMIFAGPAFSYVQYVFTGTGLVLLIAIIITIFLAIGAFEKATYTAVEMRDGAVLATFFFLGISLIFIYHVLWVIYMGTLISIWPFKVILLTEGK